MQHVEQLLISRGMDDEAAKAREQAFCTLEEIEIAHSKTARPVEQSCELIRLLRSHDVKVGVVTRNCRSASELSIRVAGLDTDLLLLAREDTPKTKPHPDHLLAALELLDACAGRSAMVGDHLMDIEAGKAAGMRTIGLLAPERPRDFFDPVEPDVVIECLREIIDAFVDLHC